MRFAAFPLSYDDALGKCHSDGADLLYISSNEMNVSKISLKYKIPPISRRFYIEFISFLIKIIFHIWTRSR